ncbi:MAG: hypothetical protein A4S17_01935 [Proteobacteria bacterium HN_bin10]|nr:MAG: hypothetical protein A4S17_01935 [Proteobacteria bacterium HN_bin10]
MGLVGLYVVIYGIPAFVASVPGLFALANQRRLLGWSVIAGAVVVTIPLAILADRARTRAHLEAGHIPDDYPVSLVLPFFLGVLYLLAATIVCVAFALLIKRPQSSNN